MKKLILLPFSALFLLASCTPKVKTPSAGGTKVATAERLAQGKTIFENSCHKCHDLPEPAKHTDEQWIGLMNAMAPKAKLTDEQSTIVYDYVTSQN